MEHIRISLALVALNTAHVMSEFNLQQKRTQSLGCCILLQLSAEPYPQHFALNPPKNKPSPSFIKLTAFAGSQ